MYRVIFVPISSSANRACSVSFTAMMAAAFNAKADCLFASKSLELLQSEQKNKVENAYLKKGYFATQELTDQFYEEQYLVKANQAGEWFHQFQQKLEGGNRLYWRDSLDLFVESIEQIHYKCSFYDLVVMSVDIGVSVYSDFVSGGLFHSGKPMVLLQEFEPNRKLEDLTIMLAWKPCKEAQHALWYSLPLLQKAKRVILVNVEEKEGLPPSDLERYAEYLSMHGVKISHTTIRNTKNPPIALEQYYKEQNADLLVMGAYSHSRFKEMVFGGFTDYFLNIGKCNLLLAH